MKFPPSVPESSEDCILQLQQSSMMLQWGSNEQPSLFRGADQTGLHTEEQYEVSPFVEGGGYRLLPFDANLDDFVLTEHRSSEYSDYMLRFVSYIPRDEMNTKESHDVVWASMPLQTLGPFLTVRSADLVLKAHQIQCVRSWRLTDILGVLNAHQCSDCREYVAGFELREGPRVLHNKRQKKYDDLKRLERDVLGFDRTNEPSGPSPPLPITQDLELRVLRNGCESLSPQSFEESGCAVCGKLTRMSDLTQLKAIRNQLNVLDTVQFTRRERRSAMEPVEPIEGPVIDSRCNMVCSDCRRHVRNNTIPKFGLANGLWLGDVPKELSELMYFERLLVAKVRHTVTWVKVASGMRKMKSNVLTFESPMPKIYQVLPPPREDMAEVFAVLFTGPSKPEKKDYERVPILVRRNHVYRALQWLKLNHCDYADVEISIDNLNSYPEDVPAVSVQYIPKGDNKSVLDSSLDDMEEEDGVESGPCPFTVHGLVAANMETVSSDMLKAMAIAHLNNEGRFLNIHSGPLVSMWKNPQLYPQMFPWLFPYGLGGIGSVRGLSTKKHKKHLLLYHDKRFQLDPNFPFVAFSHEQMSTTTYKTKALAERSKFKDISRRLLTVDLDVLGTLSTRMANGERIKPETDMEKQCLALVKDLDIVMAKVDGSITTKLHMRGEVWSLTAACGSPSWYFTMAPADSKNPICIYFARTGEKFNPELGSEKQRVRDICANPAAAARFFHYMVEVFIVHVLGFGSKEGGAFGPVRAYYGTVEQQGRLTLHIHMLIWIIGTLSPQETRNKIMSDEIWQRAVVRWLESVHCGEFATGTLQEVRNREKDMAQHPSYKDPVLTMPEAPPLCVCDSRDGASMDGNVLNDLARSIQNPANESSTDVIMEDGTLGSLNSLPNAGSPDATRDGTRDTMQRLSSEKDSVDPECDCDSCATRESWWRKYLRMFDSILAKTNVHDCERSTFGKRCKDNRYKRCRARFPRPTRDHTQVDESTGALLMKKGEACINFVTRVVTYLFRCNSDTTCLLSGTAVKAVIVYVTDYITKPGLKTHILYDAIKSVVSKSAEMIGGDLKDKEKARILMTKIVNVLTAKMEMGAPMICMYLLENPDHYTSHAFKPLYWKQYTNYVSRSFLSELHCEDEDDKVMLSNVDGEIVEISFVFDYVFRAPELEGLSLYEFVQRCSRVAIPKRGAGKLPKHTYPFTAPHPLVSSYALRVRFDDVSQIIPNFLGPRLPRPDVGENSEYATAMLTLFVPWRTGLDLRNSTESWNESFNRHEFPEHFQQVMKNINLKYECLDARDDFRGQLLKDFASDPVDSTFVLPSIITSLDDPDTTWSFDHDEWAMFLDEPDSLTGRELVRLGNMKEMSRVMQLSGWGKSLRTGIKPTDEAIKEPAPHRHQAFWKAELNKKKEEIIAQRAGGVAGDTEGQEASRSKDGEHPKVPYIHHDSAGHVTIDDKAYLLRNAVPDLERQTALMDTTAKEFKLNYQQEKAFRIVARHSLTPYSDKLRMYIGGMGGTGKTRVLEALQHFFALRGLSHWLVVVAPTGSAAALLGGMTYHSAFGINDKATKDTNASVVQSRLTGVRYVFFDEVSMLAATDMYRISARLCHIFNNADEAFGGLNMIFAGDFAQLPPAIGGDARSLYGRCKGSGSKDSEQKAAIGRSLWHSVTTVVMLKVNMRQTGKDPADDKFRRALMNMRYKACDHKDIAFLRSRISSTVPGEPSICDPQFRNVSIITTQNLLKDAINDMGSKRFAEESGATLRSFFSDDEIACASEGSDEAKGRSKRKKIVRELNHILQHDLWAQVPSTVDGHIPGRLDLCVGLPVILRSNSATELGVTNGQEGYVHSWQSSVGSHGQTVLDVLFVELKKPPRPVKLPSLPTNVVPIFPSTTTNVECLVRGNYKIHVNRTQVEVLPNFAMTDFASQGKTRPFNVVDLWPCSTHQSMYTALSRGSTASGTIILRDFPREVITGGLHGSPQLQEFRSLEMLDEITELSYKGELPAVVVGAYRKDLIAAYRAWRGLEYVPESMPRAIRWSIGSPWLDDQDDISYLPWQLVQARGSSPNDKGGSDANTNALRNAAGSRPVPNRPLSSGEQKSARKQTTKTSRRRIRPSSNNSLGLGVPEGAFAPSSTGSGRKRARYDVMPCTEVVPSNAAAQDEKEDERGDDTVAFAGLRAKRSRPHDTSCDLEPAKLTKQERLDKPVYSAGAEDHWRESHPQSRSDAELQPLSKKWNVRFKGDIVRSTRTSTRSAVIVSALTTNQEPLQPLCPRPLPLGDQEPTIKTVTLRWNPKIEKDLAVYNANHPSTSSVPRPPSASVPQSPKGTVWQDNSCAYDALIVILADVQFQYPEKWRSFSEYLGCFEFDLLTGHLERCRHELTSLTQVRNAWRSAMVAWPDGEFAYGRYTGIYDLVNATIRHSQPTYEIQYECASLPPYCIERPPGPAMVVQRSTCYLEIDRYSADSSITSWLNEHLRRGMNERNCDICDQPMRMTQLFTMQSPLLCFGVHSPSALQIDLEVVVPAAQGPSFNEVYVLAGIIYFGGGHFTSRIVRNGHVWYHDGMVHGSSPQYEGLIDQVGDLRSSRGKVATTVMHPEQRSHTFIMKCLPTCVSAVDMGGLSVAEKSGYGMSSYTSFPLELQQRAIEDMDFTSIAMASQVSKLMSSLARAVINTRIAAALSPFHLEAPQTMRAMRKTNACIMGAFTLSALFPETPVVCNTIDFYVQAGPVARLFKDALFHGTQYTELDRSTLRQRSDSAEYPLFGIELVTSYSIPSTSHEVRIVEVASEDPMDALFYFSATHLMNVITSWGVGTAYPRLTLAKKGLVRLPVTYKSDDISSMVKRYRSEDFYVGYWWGEGPIMRVLEGHECEMRQGCPDMQKEVRAPIGLLFMRLNDSAIKLSSHGPMSARWPKPESRTFVFN